MTWPEAHKHEELASELDELRRQSVERASSDASNLIIRLQSAARRAATTIRQLSRDLAVTYGNYTSAIDVGRQWQAHAGKLSRDLEEARGEAEEAADGCNRNADLVLEWRARVEVLEAALREAERLLPRLTPGNVAHIRGALMPQIRLALSQTGEPMSKSRAKRLRAQTDGARCTCPPPTIAYEPHEPGCPLAPEGEAT